MDKELVRITALRLTKIRGILLHRFPFYGRLLMHLPLGFADCGTAYTDMCRIVFDPQFVARIEDEQVGFILLHELMHCVLKHCVRGRGCLPQTYNVACDIVVNSMLLGTMRKNEMLIDGEAAIHLTPDGQEGRLFSAEDVYRMLCNCSPSDMSDSAFDSHAAWRRIAESALLADTWDRRVMQAAKFAGVGSGISASLMRHIEQLQSTHRIDWHQVLHDFLQHDNMDYSFLHPDRRFSDAGFMLPSFQPKADKESLRNIWFVVDTSGSMPDVSISEVMGEIVSAAEQIGDVQGFISFFDCEVSEPVPFSCIEDIAAIKPIGGGGTSFAAIFEYMQKAFKGELPEAIVIMTDGYASFPNEDASAGVPVIWVLTGDSPPIPPWGNVTRIGFL